MRELAKGPVELFKALWTEYDKGVKLDEVEIEVEIENVTSNDNYLVQGRRTTSESFKIYYTGNLNIKPDDEIAIVNGPFADFSGNITSVKPDVRYGGDFLANAYRGAESTRKVIEVDV